MPTEYVVLLTTLAVLEGVAKHMAPDYRLTDTVADYVRSSLPGRIDPEQLKKAALRTLARYTHLFDELPVGSREPCGGPARASSAWRCGPQTTTAWWIA